MKKIALSSAAVMVALLSSGVASATYIGAAGTQRADVTVSGPVLITAARWEPVADLQGPSLPNDTP